jgi:SAM-dependent methyltransferase
MTTLAESAAHWDARYRTGNTPWNTTAPSTELMRVIAETPVAPCTAIDLGCGTGAHSLWLAQQRFDVTGVDVSPLVIEHASARAATAGLAVHFVVADLLAGADVGGPYDFFFDRACYHYLREVDLERYLDCVARATRPGSLGLVLAGNARERVRRPLVAAGGVRISVTGPPAVTEEQLVAEWAGRFEIVSLREFRFDPGERDPGGWLGWSCLLRRR